MELDMSYLNYAPIKNVMEPNVNVAPLKLNYLKCSQQNNTGISLVSRI